MIHKRLPNHYLKSLTIDPFEKILKPHYNNLEKITLKPLTQPENKKLIPKYNISDLMIDTHIYDNLSAEEISYLLMSTRKKIDEISNR
jgi:hypothetical protein